MIKLNRRVIQILNLFGDMFNKKREVTQWFYFDNLTNLEKCELHLNNIGFKTQYKDLRCQKRF
ncbi:MAG: hypothetical protein COZ17_00335 [Flavobacteriaceae bacterium CG_4_10_14_3_um_filter_33_47]|nr:MAG: hypothetical protein COW44_11810 [Flavobacteriaceae bacterium CG17_big_fil_post_rev_8_21_14_2_50_33_15]PIY13452.1 MAG: hypothetical protein COZ17_00335 [Flavobacteriaceae bacterium CG_4_10_14_3_um_filter_33_47]PJB18479.1 MAG: hypothetical protein CO117_08085 [Flavobacteriaceae bacterium CG_4_9_14_3_um_filter_33_16]